MTDFRSDRRRLIGAGALLGWAGLLAGSRASAQSSPEPKSWTPTDDAKDSWLDRPGTRHRSVIDTSDAESGQAGLYVANNLYQSNKDGYGIEAKDIGMVVVLRHLSAPFGYNDKMWSKYGSHFADALKLEGKDAIRAAKANPLLTAEDPDDKDAVTLSTLFAKGARFPVCAIATHGAAMQIAKKTKGSAEEIEKELGANLIPGAVMAASGVLAVNRAQEHGYTFVSTA
jgi:intracellular sulfur oxidation DsrE/DsrF family protein